MEKSVKQTTDKAFSQHICAANDHLKHEGDAIDENVILIKEPNFIRRRHADSVQENVRRDSMPSFSRSKEAMDRTHPNEAIDTKINSAKGSGSRMDERTGSFMESRFGV